MELIATTVEQLLAVPTPYGYVEALPEMAKHLTAPGQALAKWYWESNTIGEVRTIAGLIEQMSEVAIKRVPDDHGSYDDFIDGEYVNHLGQDYAVYW